MHSLRIEHNAEALLNVTADVTSSELRLNSLEHDVFEWSAVEHNGANVTKTSELCQLCHHD